VFDLKIFYHVLAFNMEKEKKLG